MLYTARFVAAAISIAFTAPAVADIVKTAANFWKWKCNRRDQHERRRNQK